MNYYYLRLLALLKRGLGRVMTWTAKAYNSLTAKITNGISKESAKIQAKKDLNIAVAENAAAEAMEQAARMVADIPNVVKAETDAADIKLFKLTTKVQ